MRQCRGYWLLTTLIVCWSLMTARTVRAAGQFQEKAVVTYTVKVDGTTEVVHKIDLKNIEPSVYAAGFTLTLDGYVPSNTEAFDRGGRMAVSQRRVGPKTLLNLTFNDVSLGKGNSYAFTIRYTQSDIAREKGQVWEVIIPKQADAKEAQDYTLKLVVPASLGRVSFVSPADYKRQDDGLNRTFIFGKEQVADSRVVAAFGPRQVFNFNLKYRLQNKENIPQKEEIALPPDTGYQRVMFETIVPTPDSVRVDEDGNWLAGFLLAPYERLEIVAKGMVEISLTTRGNYRLTDAGEARYLAASHDWPIDDPKIRNLAKELKTPNKIYDYVVSHLRYDYGQTGVVSGVKRLGARGALDNPGKAICTEFTGLFIALARAAGIPARELQGYAYTNDLQLQPLSLVRDVLHAWPEFWDVEKQKWIQVDPTWGSTTGGVDFFTQLDFNHFVFVVHGANTADPQPAGSYRIDGSGGKDVNVSFGEFKPFGEPHLGLYYQPRRWVEIPFLASQGRLIVKNLGTVSASDLKINLQGSGFGGTDVLSVGVIPPYGSADFAVGRRGGIVNLFGEKVSLSVDGSDGKSTKVGMSRLAAAQMLGVGLVVSGCYFVIRAVFWRKRFGGVYFDRGRAGKEAS